MFVPSSITNAQIAVALKPVLELVGAGEAMIFADDLHIGGDFITFSVVPDNPDEARTTYTVRVEG